MTFAAFSSHRRYHESQFSDQDWHLHSTHELEDVQRDPRAISDGTDEEEVQIDPRKYMDGDCEKFLEDPSFDLPPEHLWQQEDHHENKYCDQECSYTCNYKAVSPSYLDNLIWRDSEVNHYYEPKLIIDLSNWKEQQSKEKIDKKGKSKCEKNGLVKAQIALKEASQNHSVPEKDRDQEKHQNHNQGFDFDSFIASTIKLSLQPESGDVDLLNELNTSVSQLDTRAPCGSMSKSISQEKEEKCLVNLAQLGVRAPCPWESFTDSCVAESSLIDQACWDVRKDEQLQKENSSCQSSYLDRLFSKRDDVEPEILEPVEVVSTPESDFISCGGEIVFNMQLESLAIPGFEGAADIPLKSIQATLTPSAVKHSPQIAHKTYSSIFKHLN